MKTRKYYEQLFNKYPDVVTLSQFRNMLGGSVTGLQESSCARIALSTITSVLPI